MLFPASFRALHWSVRNVSSKVNKIYARIAHFVINIRRTPHLMEPSDRQGNARSSDRSREADRLPLPLGDVLVLLVFNAPSPRRESY